MPGSSPLARGTQSDPPAPGGFFGLIPARAGNTCPCTSSFVTDWAHPRSRGEHPSIHSGHCRNLGSSPLARGTRKTKPLLEWQGGLIPARAGNTMNLSVVFNPSGAHPRSRGEHLASCDSFRPSSGSSPLARGTQRLPPVPSSVNGLIPARAGNTEY